MYKLGQEVYYHNYGTMGRSANDDTWGCGVASGKVITFDDDKVCLIPTGGTAPVFIDRDNVFRKFELAWAFSYGCAHQCKRANDPTSGRGCAYKNVLFVCGKYREVLLGEDIPEFVGWK